MTTTTTTTTISSSSYNTTTTILDYNIDNIDRIDLWKNHTWRMSNAQLGHNDHIALEE